MSIDHFAHKASSYEDRKDRVDNVANIADAIVRAVPLARAMHLMDFGSGTGILLERIAPHVRKISAVDVSPSMNAQLRAKSDKIACEVEILEIDLSTAPLTTQFDGIISSMTMHHIKDVPRMFAKFHALLKAGGFVAIADLESEDGSFHSEDTGVHHSGFEPQALIKVAQGAGFKSVTTATVSVIQKEQGAYPVFLLTGVK